MADKKLNEVTKVTDMAYVTVIMSDGSIGQIAKADLASVVAGNMCKQLVAGTDLNTITANGFYYIGSTHVNAPISYFYFITMKGLTTTDLVQFGFSLTNGNMYKRSRNNGVWSNWHVYTGTSL